MENFRKIFLGKNQPKLFAFLFLIFIALGIFLRTYNFHDWLRFEPDQLRDAILVDGVIEGNRNLPFFGPTIKKSGESNNELFQLGPVFYYFQIVSAKIFGNEPDKMAYPDLLLSILTIPLFYFFLKRYFGIGVSLSLAGLFAVSFFAVFFSRFAWNPNSIPFFAILLLLSLHEFLKNEEKTSWFWVFSIGTALGIGIQLHAITFILFPATAFFVFVFLLKKNRKIWKKIAVVILIFLTLNITQIISETKSGFSNTKVLLNSPVIKNNSASGLLNALGNDLDCHSEANWYMLFATGSDECGFLHKEELKKAFSAKFFNKIDNGKVLLFAVLIFLFSLFGYFILVRYSFEEKNAEKRFFLKLVLLYVILSFLIMFPILKSDSFAGFRYFNHVFFVPFIFLGFLEVLLFKKLPLKLAVFVSVILFLCLLFSNFLAIKSVASELFTKNRNSYRVVVLGETEDMVEYIITNSDNQKEAYLSGRSGYLSFFYGPLRYLAKKRNFNIIQIEKDENVFLEKSLFYITKSSEKPDIKIKDVKIECWKKFGKLSIYKLAKN